jgi:hypothetical protein
MILLMGASSTHPASMKGLQASAGFKTTQFQVWEAMAANKAPGPNHTQDFPITAMLRGYHI